MISIKQYFTLDLRTFVFSSLWCALIIVGGFISLPIGPVPVAFADFFVMLSACMQNPLQALISVGLYITFGVIGLPVFAGGKAGVGVLLGPTGGFLVGYVFLSLIISFLTYNSEHRKVSPVRFFIAVLVANFVLYLFGVLGLMRSLSLTFAGAIKVGVVPFVFGTVIKIALCYILYSKVSQWQR